MREFKYSWEEFKKLPLTAKKKLLVRDNELAYLIFSQQFDKKCLEVLFALADKIRTLAKNKTGADWLQTLLSDKRATLFFSQPSTRTFKSFYHACHILGIKIGELRDGASSSQQKGESSEDTILTFASYTDLIIMRNAEEHLAEKSAWLMNKKNRVVRIINAGSGKDQHPTQSLLDAYTMDIVFKNRGGVEGKIITIVGDLKRGRAARSLIYILKNYPGVKLRLVSPEQLKIEPDIKKFLEKNEMEFIESDNLKESVKQADVIYMTRMQDEYDITDESKRINFAKFHLTRHHLKLIKKDAIIMHPLPRREEIDVDVDDDIRAHYWKQERNGMWVRAALIAYMFGKKEKIMNYEEKRNSISA
jgi:aspartate carbamoyltransferase catalytic subunit